MIDKRRQQGFFKLFFIFGSIAFVAVVVMKLFPLYSNQFKVAKAIKSTASEGYIEPFEVQKSLQKRWDIEDISQLTPKEIKIERNGEGGGALVYDYEARTPLFYNVSIVLHFQGREIIN